VDVEGVLAIVFIFGGGALFLLSVSPVGRAFAGRIANRAAADDPSVRQLIESQHALTDDLEALREEMGQMQERLDFTERLLARQGERGQLPKPESPPA
jgi:hypothetical protein